MAWKEPGKLCIFSEDDVTILRPWGPKAGAWYKSEERPEWGHIFPAITIGRLHAILVRRRDAVDELHDCEASHSEDAPTQLLLPFPTRRHEAIGRFFDEIPQIALRFTLRAPERDWALLQFLNRCGCPGAAFGLCYSNFPLALALSHSDAFHRVTQPMRARRSLVCKRQREILQWLGFPAGSVQTFRKIVPCAAKVSRLLFLRHAMARPEVMKVLWHLGRVNAGVIRIVSDDRLWSAVAPSLVQEVSESRWNDVSPRAAYEISDGLEMWRLFQGNRPPPALHSMAGLRAWHNELVEAMNRNPDVVDDAEFPLPPLPDVPGVLVALPSVADLIEEGRAQQNCVASYAGRVARGTNYIYRLLSPRATVSVYRRGMQWFLGEAKAACNRPLDDETYDFLLQWIRQSQPQFYRKLNTAEPEVILGDPF